LSDRQLDWTPDAKTWHSRQIIEHLTLSDETVGQAREAGEIEPEAPMFRMLPRSIRRALILGAMRRDIVLPLPSPDIAPTGETPLAELLSRWDAVRGEMRRKLDVMQNDENRYAHPVLGPLNAARMLELSETHTAYHTRQMEALQRGANFPRAAED